MFLSLFYGDEGGLLDDMYITQDMIKSKILKLQDGKAPGDDGIIPVFLKKYCRCYSRTTY